MHASEVLAEMTDTVVDVSLLVLCLDPVLVSAHVEETLEGVLASRVVWVKVVFFLLALGLLDVPEDVSGQLIEDLGRSGGGHALVEGTTQICNIVVFLAFLEGVELARKDFVPFLHVEASVLNLIEHSDTDLVFILSLKSLRVLVCVECFPELVLREHTRNFLLLHLVEDGTILKGLCASERLENPLLEGALLVASRLVLAYAIATHG